MSPHFPLLSPWKEKKRRRRERSLSIAERRGEPQPATVACKTEAQSERARVSYAFLARFGADSHARSALVDKTSASELSRKFIKGALSVGRVVVVVVEERSDRPGWMDPSWGVTMKTFKRGQEREREREERVDEVGRRKEKERERGGEEKVISERAFLLMCQLTQNTPPLC